MEKNLEKDLSHNQKSLEIARKVGAKNISELEEKVSHIQREIEKTNIEISNHKTKVTEYMVLDKKQDKYIILSENGNISPDFSLKLKEYMYQEDIDFHSCSMKITSVSESLSLFVRK